MFITAITAITASETNVGVSAAVTRSWLFARKKGVRTASDAVDRMLVDVTTVLAGAWLVSIGLSLPSSDAGLAVPLAGWLVLAVASVAWFLSLLLRVTPRWVFIATAGIGLLILTASTSPEYWSGAGPVMVTWAKMYAVCSAPLLQERKAVAVIVGMGLALAATILVAGITVVGLSGLTLRGALFAVVSSVALGMATVGVVGALRRVGRASDDAAIEAQDALAAEAHEKARRDEADRFAAVTHDGLINTLGAVARGSGERNRSLTIERCRADAIEMRSFLSAERPQGTIGDKPHTGFVGEVAEFARGRAGLLGLELTVAVEAQVIAIPHRVSEAICSIVGEALINVSKHSGVGHATLTIAGGVDWVLIEILDEGNGFDPATRGNPQGIANRCERLGIGLAIETAPGSGTLVRLEWKASESDVSVGSPANASPSLLERARRQMVRSLCWWLLGLFVAQTVASWGLAPLAGNLVALALIIPACLVGVRWADLGKPLPPGASLYLVLVAGLVTFSSGAGAIGCARLEISWWGATAGFLCLVLLVLLSSRGWFVAGAISFVLGAAAVSWELGIQEASQGPSGCGPWSVPPLLVEVVVVLVGIWLMQPLMARYARAALGWRLEASRTRQRTAWRAAWDEIQRRRGDRALGSALVLLDSIADGSVDPSAHEVRAECAREERHLRSLIALDFGLLELGDVLAEVIRFGRSCGVEVVIDSGEPVDLPGAAELRGIDVVLRAVVGFFDPGSVIHLAIFPAVSGGRITVMSDRRPAGTLQVMGLRGLECGSLRVVDLSDEDEFFVELVWPG